MNKARTEISVYEQGRLASSVAVCPDGSTRPKHRGDVGKWLMDRQDFIVDGFKKDFQVEEINGPITIKPEILRKYKGNSKLGKNFVKTIAEYDKIRLAVNASLTENENEDVQMKIDAKNDEISGFVRKIEDEILNKKSEYITSSQMDDFDKLLKIRTAGLDLSDRLGKIGLGLKSQWGKIGLGLKSQWNNKLKKIEEDYAVLGMIWASIRYRWAKPENKAKAKGKLRFHTLNLIKNYGLPGLRNSGLDDMMFNTIEEVITGEEAGIELGIDKSKFNSELGSEKVSWSANSGVKFQGEKDTEIAIEATQSKIRNQIDQEAAPKNMPKVPASDEGKSVLSKPASTTKPLSQIKIHSEIKIPEATTTKPLSKIVIHDWEKYDLGFGGFLDNTPGNIAITYFP